jgi:DNA repair exonuclease SbcCD ATPase subunit
MSHDPSYEVVKALIGHSNGSKSSRKQSQEMAINSRTNSMRSSNDVSDLEEKISRLESQLSTAEFSILQLQTESALSISKLHEEIKSRDRMISSLKSSLEHVDHRIKKEVQQSKEETSKFQITNQQQANEISKLQAELVYRMEQLQKASNTLQRVRAREEKLQQMNHTQVEEIDKWKNGVTMLQNKYSDVTKVLDSLEQANKSLSTSMETLQTQNAKLKVDIARIEDEWRSKLAEREQVHLKEVEELKRISEKEPKQRPDARPAQSLRAAQLAKPPVPLPPAQVPSTNSLSLYAMSLLDADVENPPLEEVIEAEDIESEQLQHQHVSPFDTSNISSISNLSESSLSRPPKPPNNTNSHLNSATNSNSNGVLNPLLTEYQKSAKEKDAQINDLMKEQSRLLNVNKNLQEAVKELAKQQEDHRKNLQTLEAVYESHISRLNSTMDSHRLDKSKGDFVSNHHVDEQGDSFSGESKIVTGLDLLSGSFEEQRRS